MQRRFREQGPDLSAFRAETAPVPREEPPGTERREAACFLGGKAAREGRLHPPTSPALRVPSGAATRACSRELGAERKEAVGVAAMIAQAAWAQTDGINQ